MTDDRAPDVWKAIDALRVSIERQGELHTKALSDLRSDLSAGRERAHARTLPTLLAACAVLLTVGGLVATSFSKDIDRLSGELLLQRTGLAEASFDSRSAREDLVDIDYQLLQIETRNDAISYRISKLED